ncbi:hypothetical protein AAW14_06780 [Streptomyces hygroscopicus]|uniref:VWA domain-containing protein n=1 Tax=Streptomyces hygroscopicus TaxID=1912 RepID=UPI00223F7AD5|nr:VWA domain-containing protein [Streptomyces hygroscopicus]MCW7941769.1 hypothetical protein [Streptomyces hygroscopicus]
MGILTLLRNAFGRSRKGRSAEEEPSRETPRTTEPKASDLQSESAPAEIPAQSSGLSDEHELVAAAFDSVTVPRQASRTQEPNVTPEPTVEAEPTAAAESTPEPTIEAESTETAAEPEGSEEPGITPEPAVAEKPTAEEPEPEGSEEPGITPEPAVAEKPTTEEPEPEAADEREATKPEAEAADEKPKPQEHSKPEQSNAEEPKPEAPKTEAETPAEATAEPESKREPESEPESKREPESEPESKREPESEPESKREPEPVSVAEAATDRADDVPAAADGEEAPQEAPQEAPAADGESRTGGAGGNDPAEGEAEAAPPAKATPALALARVKSSAPGLTTAYKAAADALKKHDLTGTRAQVYLVLDRSASMRPYYKDGSAQALGEQALALAAHLDPEATVHVVFFSTELDGTGELTLTDHENKIDELHAGLGRMGRTSYHAAVEAVIAHHEKSPDPALPALVIFQTDGAPDAKTPATQSLTDAAKSHPGLFFSFVAFGDPENKAFDYLRKLKTDNTSCFLAGETPRELTDTEVYEGVLMSWRP